MDENLAPTRQLDQDNSLEPASKILKVDHDYALDENAPPKPNINYIMLPVPYNPARKLLLYQPLGAKLPILFHEGDEHPHAYTKLPPEILLDIFDYLKPDDNCMKKLSTVCKKFYNLCAPRLTVLKLDFDEIIETNQYPVIRRGYAEIRIIGAEIDYHCEEIGKILQSSSETARKLIISNANSSKSVIKMRCLLFILRSLPNLEEVEINGVNGLMPRCSWKKIKWEEKPKLSNLRELTLTNIPAVICSAFDRVQHIEQLKMEITSFEQQYYNAYRYLVIQQKKLRLLDLDANITYSVCKNRSAEAALGGNDFEKLLCNFPKLEHIKLAASYSKTTPASGRRITQALLTAGRPVASMKTIELSFNSCNGPFDIDQIRKKFPSLQSFKSDFLNWSITSA